MDKIHVIYGSTTGTTEMLATRIAAELGTAAVNIVTADDSAFDAEVLVLGSSTWGYGDLQDDWMNRLDNVKDKFAGKKIAVFGAGDSVGFSDTFCVAADTIAQAAESVGTTLVGEIARFDETNEADKTDARLVAFVSAIKEVL